MMRSFFKWMLGTVALTVMFVLAMPAQKAQAQDDYVSYQTFYDDLAPYGQWVNDPSYGNVWVPDVENDFRPYYTRGYWAATDYGNTWVSDYPWGWAAFHYGRWTYNPFYGWVWIPGNTWGPAWVNWRTGGGYYGWAPLGPGISMSMSFGNYSCPTDWWVFVGPQYIYNRNFHNHWRGPQYNTTIINQTTIINNTYNNTYVYGPRPRDIERVTNQRVNMHRIADGQRGRTQVRNNTLSIYRPQVRGNAESARPRGVVQAPRSIGSPQSVRNTRPEFKAMVQRGEVKPGSGVRNDVGARQDRFDSRGDQRDRTNQVRPTPNTVDRVQPGRQMDRGQQNIERRPTERQQPQRIDRQMQRPQMQQQRMERPQMQRQQQMERQQPQHIERQQMQRPQMERQQQQRMERPQMQQQRMERPQMERQQQQRMERPQMQQQRMERPQMQRQQPQQRMERPQMQRQQPQQRMERPQMQQQRMERPQMQRQQPQQRMERPQMQQQRMERQSAPAPRPQPQGRPDMGNRGDNGNRGGGRR